MAGFIVVGVDGSPSSRQALRWAAREAALRDAEVRVVTAWTIPWSVYSSIAVPDDLGKDLETAATEQAADMIAELGPDAEGVQVRTVVREGDPAHVLLHEAEGAELLVVGSRGLGGFRDLLLGSVSQQCAHHAPCPVVILRGSGAGDHPHAAR